MNTASNVRPIRPDRSDPDGESELREFFDRSVDEHERWRRTHHHYYDEETRLLPKLIPAGKKILEIGSATGDTLAALRPADGLGVDISPRMVGRARQKFPHLRFEVQDAERLDLGGETFDYVVLSGFVGESRDLWAAFRNLRDVVHERTRVIVTYFNLLWQPVLDTAQALGLKRQQMLQNWFSLDDIDGLLSLSGFETVTEGHQMLMPLDVPVLSPLLNRLGPAVPGLRRAGMLQYLVARPGPAFDVEPEELSVTVVIPAKNERGNIRPAIRRTPKMGKATEIIFVEGGSEDGTREEILQAIEDEPTECTLRFVPQTGKGKGDAVRTAFAAARNDVLMILDADLTVMPEDLPRFYDAIAERRGEFINGCRLVYQLEDQAMRTLNFAANKFFGVAFSYVLGQPLKDTLCGTKVLRREDYETIAANRHVFGDLDPFGDFDLLYGAARLGMRIKEIPVRYRARRYGETQISRFRHGATLFRMLARGFKHFRL